MGYSLEQFSTECHRILEQDPGLEDVSECAPWFSRC
jgi:hypothetical protein